MNKINNTKIDAFKKQQIDMAMHCDEVQEVMGEIPSWIVRWGITVIFAIVVALIVGSYFFYYPDVVKSNIRITSLGSNDDSIKSVGEIIIPAIGSGKVMPGQQVNVFVANYPYSEYGYVTGVIDCINETPDVDGNYRVTVAFPNGMRTNYGNSLRTWQVMSGTAEIILENKRLTEKLLQSFNLIKK
jgi:hypothetical protein